MSDFLTRLAEHFQDPKLRAVLLSALLFLLLGLTHALWILTVRRRSHLPVEVRRRWIVQARNALLMAMLIGLVIIWAEQLRLVAVSMLAVAVATVIALKELIMCLSGSALRIGGRAFQIGDRIEVGHFRGDVVDYNALTTTLLEAGPGNLTQQLTGRAVVFPNSLFLTTPVINETYTEDYVLHVFTLPGPLDGHWEEREGILHAIAQEECREFLQPAQAYFERLGRQRGLVTMAVDPRVNVTLVKPDEVEYVVRVAVPARRKGRVQQNIVREYLRRTATAGHLAPPPRRAREE